MIFYRLRKALIEKRFFKSIMGWSDRRLASLKTGAEYNLLRISGE